MEKKDSPSEERSEKELLDFNSQNPPWWLATETGRKPHEILDNVLRQIEDDQSGRYQAYKEYEKAFGATISADRDTSIGDITDDSVVQNELQNTIETLWAQVFKDKIVPAVSVSEADWDEWNQAKSYSRWLEGAFDEAGIYRECFPKAGAYSLVHGTGIIRVGWQKVNDKTAKVIAWPVNPRYFAVDRLEAKHGHPRSFYFKDHIDRYVLWAKYKEDRPEYYGTVGERKLGIEKVTSNDDLELGNSATSRCDMVTVREAFHLPSGPNAGDGKHVI